MVLCILLEEAAAIYQEGIRANIVGSSSLTHLEGLNSMFIIHSPPGCHLKKIGPIDFYISDASTYLL